MDQNTANRLLQKMLQIRCFEERCAAAYRERHIGGFCHLYIGQEAVVVGAQESFRKGDATITGYRDHAHMLACDMDAGAIMSELFGKKNGLSKGKGGSMHMFSVDQGFYGGHGIVGAQIPLGTGMALALKMQKKKGESPMVFAYLGDGACAQGQVYESFNMASLYKAPVLYIIENNGYAMGTAVARHASGSELYERGAAFGISGEKIDGMNLLTVLEKVAEYSDKVRKTSQPHILEVATYRHVGHSVSDPGTYMPLDEKKLYKEKDPIQNFALYMQKHKMLDESQYVEMQRLARAEALESYNFAEKDDAVPESELMTDIIEEGAC